MNRLTRGVRRSARTVAGAAVLLGVLVAAGALAPEAESSTGPTPAVVAANLGADSIPAALVILVDTSASMAPPAQTYAQVYTQLPQFLIALHKQDPGDEVSVVQFADKADTQVVYNWGSPQDFHPDQHPKFARGTDIGYAFNVALNQFNSAPKSAQVDGVLLLSDGVMWAPDDSEYDGTQGYNAPGWAQLRQRVSALPVTGYALPLNSTPGLPRYLNQALSKGFGSQHVLLSSNYSSLGEEMGATQQRILDSRVATAAAPDSGRGVQVAWSGAGVTNGTVQLNPAAGTADLSLTLTATTKRVPLTVRNLRASLSGFPEPISSTAAGDLTLPPGHSVTVPLHLSWKPITSGDQPWSGTITLEAKVGSPYSDAIRNYYLDRFFKVGRLDNPSAYYQAGPPPPLNALLIAVIILLVLLLLAAIAVVLFFRLRLVGTLTFEPVDGRGRTEALPKLRPWYKFDTSELGVQQGMILVRRSLKTGEMRMTSSLYRRNPVTVRDNGSTTIAGIRVHHDASPSPELVGR